MILSDFEKRSCCPGRVLSVSDAVAGAVGSGRRVSRAIASHGNGQRKMTQPSVAKAFCQAVKS